MGPEINGSTYSYTHGQFAGYISSEVGHIFNIMTLHERIPRLVLDTATSITELKVLPLSSVGVRPGSSLDFEDIGSGSLAVVCGQSLSTFSSEQLRQLWRNDGKAVRVGTADFNYSDYFVYSEGFSRCQALIMWDPITAVAAVGHFNPQTDPQYMLEGHTYGPFGGFFKKVPLAQDIFKEPSRVRLAHIFGESHSFPEIWVDTALERKGFSQPVVHTLVCSPWRDVGIDAKQGIIFIARSDRNHPSVQRLITLPTE